MTKDFDSAKGVVANRAGKRLFDRKLMAYAAAAGAAVVGGQAANAIVSTRVIGPPSIFDGSANLDVDNNGVDDYQFTHSISSNEIIARVQGVNGNTVAAHLDFNQFPKANRLTGSHFVPGPNGFENQAVLAKVTSSSVNSAASSTYGDFIGKTGYLGLAFDIDGATHYGFANVTVNDQFDPEPLAITINSVGWETDARVPIHVPGNTVPEPVGLGALALGAAGLAGLRRRKA